MASTGTQIHAEQTGSGASGNGAIAANRAAQAFLALPGGKEYQADQDWFNAVMLHGYLLNASRAELESYYKMLPAFSRGFTVPTGYPVAYNGLLIQGNTLPRIVPLEPGQEKTAKVGVWPQTQVGGIAAIPSGMTAEQFIGLSDTKVYQRNAKGQAVSWFNRRYMHMLTYQPHVLFNSLFHAKRLFMDPSSQFAKTVFKTNQQVTYLQRLTLDAAIVVTAVFGGEALAGLDGTAAGAGAGATAGTTGAGTLAPTEVATAAPESSATLAPISTGAPVSGGLETAVTAPTATAAGAAGGGSTLAEVVSGAAAVNKVTGGSLLDLAKRAAGAVVGAAKAPVAAKSATAPKASATTPAPLSPYVKYAAAGFVALGILISLGT